MREPEKAERFLAFVRKHMGEEDHECAWVRAIEPTDEEPRREDPEQSLAALFPFVPKS